MRKKKFPVIPVIIIAALLIGAAVLIVVSNQRRDEVRVRMTEIAAATAKTSLSKPRRIPVTRAVAVTKEEWELGMPPEAKICEKSHSLLSQ